MTEKATFAAGCFWGVEALFRQIDGVVDAVCGYEGGDVAEPTYKQVCTGTTGHAEVVEVDYDPGKISYTQLLDAFWEMHDPTTKNRQGPDVGTQYRSGIFYHTPEQEKAARASLRRLDESGKHQDPVVTEITPASAFWRAEEYHQRYFEKNGMVNCHLPGQG